MSRKHKFLYGWGLALLVSICVLLSSCHHLFHSADPPLVVDPGTAAVEVGTVNPPSDAIVLFGGTDLSAWSDRYGRPPRWKVENGYLEIVPGSGSIWTRNSYGDVQLHIEWAAPLPVKGNGQGRGNSGIKLMGRYEVQVLNSYMNDTYPVGQAGAIYGQYPPMVNACLPPGEWQSFDIIFRAPRFADNGRLQEPAYMTVLHNGVLVHDGVALSGPTAGWFRRYRHHQLREPLMLQEHGAPVRYRNIWLRELNPAR